MNILLTGAAGFIGSHLAKKIIQNGTYVHGIDNLNDYYDVDLKLGRLKTINSPLFKFYEQDICSKEELFNIFNEVRPDVVINLAAQAGVRYSLINPQTYIDSNITGFLNILEASRLYKPKHLIYASSSSVYGINQKLPFAVSDFTDHPKSLYAATKKSNELMAHTYSELFDIPTTGLRFFTVYGPWGRPDMALFIFTKSIFEGKPIKVFNNGNMKRDFTYIDDIIEGIFSLIDNPPQKSDILPSSNFDPSISSSPYQLFNIGNSEPEDLSYFIEIIESAIGKKAIIEYHPLQPGDVEATFADIQSLQKLTNFKPATSIEEGIPKFVEWYREFYQIK